MQNLIGSMLKFFVIVIGGYLAHQYDALVIFIILIGFLLMFTNLSSERKKGELSAYSVFNKNFESIPGSFESGIPGLSKKQKKIIPKKTEEDRNKIYLYFLKPGKYANKSCFCDSGQKFKKCCLPNKKEILKSF